MKGRSGASEIQANRQTDGIIELHSLVGLGTLEPFGRLCDQATRSHENVSSSVTTYNADGRNTDHAWGRESFFDPSRLLGICSEDPDDGIEGC
jgi:hypothetical protein